MIKLKFIIETVSSEIDRNGVCYHFARIRRLSDDATFTTEVGGPSNARIYAREAGLGFEEIYEVAKTVPKREFVWLSRDMKYRLPEDLKKFFAGG